MDTVLVTGGCGYIGSHTCINLLENNFKILIIDSLINSSRNYWIGNRFFRQLCVC